MSTHFQLIPWTILTHYYDTLRHQKLQRTPMTYLDLLTELQNLSEEDLLKPVTIYDEDVEDYCKGYSFNSKSNPPNLII